MHTHDPPPYTRPASPHGPPPYTRPASASPAAHYRPAAYPQHPPAVTPFPSRPGRRVALLLASVVATRCCSHAVSADVPPEGYKQGSGLSGCDTITIGRGCDSIGFQAFFKIEAGLTMTVKYDAAALVLADKAFMKTPVTFVMECLSGCGNGEGAACAGLDIGTN